MFSWTECSHPYNITYSEIAIHHVNVMGVTEISTMEFYQSLAHICSPTYIYVTPYLMSAELAGVGVWGFPTFFWKISIGAIFTIECTKDFSEFRGPPNFFKFPSIIHKLMLALWVHYASNTFWPAFVLQLLCKFYLNLESFYELG